MCKNRCEITPEHIEYKKCQEILDIIFKALTSNSRYIYSRIFEDKAECGWITQEECNKVLEAIEKWKANKIIDI